MRPTSQPPAIPDPRTGVMAQRWHDEFVAGLMASIAEGLACSPDPPAVGVDALRAALSSLTWHGLASRDTDLLCCVQRACDAFGFDSDGSLTVERWGQVLLANAMHAMDTRRRLAVAGRPDLVAALDLIGSSHADLMRRSPRCQQFMAAIDSAAAQEIERVPD
ncbi:MAG: hypothetical protein KGP12_05635 [Actinomycetales bacterium]|nr:hypothetical protein [Actinomycetales bacterium]